MSLFSRIFDHFLFTVSFILAVQLPEFIQQYMQLINGKLAEAKYHLEKYQSVADIHFNGNFNNLITHYLNHTDPAINHTGTIVSDVFYRVETYQNKLMLVSEGSFLEKVYYFLKYIEVDSAQLTVQNYQLAVPLTLEAVSSGLFFAFISIALRMLLGFGLCALINNKRTTRFN